MTRVASVTARVMAGAAQVEFWSPGQSFLPEGPRCYVIPARRYSFVVGHPPAHREDKMADAAACRPHLSFTLKDSSTQLKRRISVDKRAVHNPPECFFPACGERQICNVNLFAFSVRKEGSGGPFVCYLKWTPSDPNGYPAEGVAAVPRVQSVQEIWMTPKVVL